MRSLIAILIPALLALGCESSQRAVAPPPAKESMRAEDSPRPSPSTIDDVMLAKTAWAAALLEAIAARDYDRVEANAEALRRLSEETSFIVQDTVTYRAYSASFRDAVAQLATDARSKNQSAIEADYHRVTDSCFQCHEYVHAERVRNPMPGRMTMRRIP